MASNNIPIIDISTLKIEDIRYDNDNKVFTHQGKEFRLLISDVKGVIKFSNYNIQNVNIDPEWTTDHPLGRGKIDKYFNYHKITPVQLLTSLKKLVNLESQFTELTLLTIYAAMNAEVKLYSRHRNTLIKKKIRDDYTLYNDFAQYKATDIINLSIICDLKIKDGQIKFTTDTVIYEKYNLFEQMVTNRFFDFVPIHKLCESIPKI